MKKKILMILLILTMLLLISCNQNQNNSYQLNESYLHVIEEKDEALNQLESINVTHQHLIEELKSKNDVLLNEIKKINETNKKAIKKLTDINYFAYYIGDPVVDDFVGFVLEVYSNTNELIWIQSWNHVQVNKNVEIVPIVYEEFLYITVDHNLYCYNLKTGQELYIINDLINNKNQPIFDSDGFTYIYGNNAPYLMKYKNDELICSFNDISIKEINKISFHDDIAVLEINNGSNYSVIDNELYKLHPNDLEVCLFYEESIIPIDYRENDFNYEDYFGKALGVEVSQITEDAGPYTLSFNKIFEYDNVIMRGFKSKDSEEDLYWIKEFTITSPLFSTYRGIKVGDSYDDLITAYPNGYYQKEYNNYQFSESFLDTINFEIKDNTIMSINLIRYLP